MISFDEISNLNCSFIDTTSLATLDSYYDIVTEKTRDIEKDYLKDDLQEWQDLLPEILEILSMFILYDKIVVDKKVLNRDFPFKNHENLKLLFQPTEIPNDVYIKALWNVANSSRFYNYKYFDLDIISCHYSKDLMEDIFSAIDIFDTFFNSGQFLERALFYLEIVRIAGASVLLNPKKRIFFKYITWIIQPELIKIIETAIDKKLLESLNRYSSNYYEHRIIFKMPPLKEYLYDFAMNNNLSLLESMNIIKNSDEAVSFRKWFGPLQKKILKQNLWAKLEVNKEISKLESLSEDWIRNINNKAGIKYAEKEVKLSAIPKIGHILEIMDIRNPKVRIPKIHSAKNYLSFISTWYENRKIEQK